jgi:hypothetical protein
MFCIGISINSVRAEVRSYNQKCYIKAARRLFFGYGAVGGGRDFGSKVLFFISRFYLCLFGGHNLGIRGLFPVLIFISANKAAEIGSLRLYIFGGCGIQPAVPSALD